MSYGQIMSCERVHKNRMNRQRIMRHICAMPPTHMHVQVNIFRENAEHMGNPVSAIHGIKVATEGGVSLDLKPLHTPPPRGAFDKPLPNCVSVTAAWNPNEHKSAVLLEPTKWPSTRVVQVTVALELSKLPGKLHEVQTPVYFLVRPQRLPCCCAP